MAALVQSRLLLGFGVPVEFASPPTVGNMMIVWLVERSATGGSSDVIGWTKHPDGGVNEGTMYYRVCDGTETWPVGFGANRAAASIMEFSDLGAVVASAESSGTTNPLTGGAGTPPAGNEVVIIGGFVCDAGDFAAASAVATGDWTELHDTKMADGFGPHLWSCYQIVASASGSYAPSGTHVTAGLTYRSQMLAFAGSGVTPPTPPEVHFDICDIDGANCVRIERAKDKRVRVELNGSGEFAFVIDRQDIQATEANLARGNIVQVTFTEIDPDPIFEGILEEGDFTLISSDEEGGEELSFGGPGTLDLLRRAILDFEPFAAGWPASVVRPEEGIWSWHDQEAGNILRRLIEEAQERGVLSGVTRTFDNVNDSASVPWVPMGSWQAPIGANLYDEAMRLVAAGQLHIEMAPGFVLNAYQTIGRDLTGGAFGSGVVRFVKGVNIADDLTRKMTGALAATNAIIQGEDGTYARAAVGGSPDYIIETFLTAPSSDEDVLEAAGARALAVREAAQEAILLTISPYGRNEGPNDEANGWYFPGPEGTDHGKFWVGDLVTLHTGADEFDYTNATYRVHAITLYEDDTGALAPPIVELNAPFPEGNQDAGTSAFPATSTSGSSGSSSSSTATHAHPYLTRVGGGRAAFLDHGNAGAAEEIDLLDGNAHWLTLDANCAITLVNAGAGSEARIRVALEQGGVGSFTVTWPTIEWVGGSAPTLLTDPADVDFVDLWTYDGGTTWYGQHLAASAAGSLTVEEDGGTPVANVDHIVFDGATVTDDTGGQVTVTITGGVTLSDDTPLVESGSGDEGTSGEASRSDHVHPADGGGGGGASRHSPSVPTGDLLRSYTFDSTVESWTASAGTITASSGQARLAHTSNTVALEPVGAANQADGEVEGLFTIVGGVEASIVFRATDASNFYMMTVTNNGTSTILYQCVAGTFAALRTCEVAQLTGGGPMVLMVRFIGSLIEGYLNGRHMFSVTNATFSTGRIGMRTFNGTLDLDTIRLYENPVLLGDNV